MKIYYKPTTETDYELLGDESDRTLLVEEFSAAVSRQVQVVPLAGGTEPFRADRGNGLTNLRLAITTSYDSTDLALVALVTLLTTFTGAVDLMIEQGEATLYFPNCTFTEYNPQLKGVAITSLLAGVGGLPTTTPP